MCGANHLTGRLNYPSSLSSLSMPAFVSSVLCGRLSLRRASGLRQCVSDKRRSFVHVAARPLRASLSMSMTHEMANASILLADDIYGQIAVGGFGIVAASIFGVIVVGYLVRNNMEAVRCENKTNPSTQLHKMSW
jgi:hypothetical protein